MNSLVERAVQILKEEKIDNNYLCAWGFQMWVVRDEYQPS